MAASQSSNSFMSQLGEQRATVDHGSGQAASKESANVHDNVRNPSEGSGAASLLLAASAMAQAPTQNVSNALLGQVHLAAAEGQLRKRKSQDGVTNPAMNMTTTQATMSGASQPGPSRYSNSLPLNEQLPQSLQISTAHARHHSTATSSSLQTAQSLATSPRSEAHFEIGKIAASAAAHEYIEQSHGLVSLPLATNAGKQWDANNPFQGVPSTPMMPSTPLAMLPPPDIVMGIRTPFASHSQLEEPPANFRPSYRLAPNEYEILASAAAVATAALTSTGYGANTIEHMSRPSEETSVRSGLQGASLTVPTQPLSPNEQQSIAATLRAWAGLEGTERQEEARKQLQQQAEQDAKFFPPDFARHYQSQLTALTAGYYQKLYSDGLAQPHWAPPSISAPSEQRSGRGHSKQLSSPTSAKMLADAAAMTLEHKRQAYELSQAVSQTQSMSYAHEAMSQRSPGETASDSLLHAQGTGAQSSNALNPMHLLSQASLSSGLTSNSPHVRDQLLQYAHHLYSNGGKTIQVDMSSDAKEGAKQSQSKVQLHPSLLPLLHTLHDLHPQHLPTLLLLSCAYYSAGDLAASLWYNKMILSIDPTYVESMSNIGTTLRALGRWNEAESWWWRAIRLRPGYWDAYENLLGVLCSAQQMPPSDKDHANSVSIQEKGQLPGSPTPTERQPQALLPRFQEALELCDFVESNVISKRQAPGESQHRKIPSSSSLIADDTPVFMPTHLPVVQGTRLQNLYYAKGNLKFVLSDYGAVPAAREYEKAVEIMISTSDDNAYCIRDLVLATYVIGILSLGATLPGTQAVQVAGEIAQAIGLDIRNPQHVQLATNAEFSTLCPGGGILRLVKKSGDKIITTLLRLGGGSHLPMLMLVPQATLQIARIIFAETEGALPALVENARRVNTNAVAIKQTLQQASSMTSTVLLTLGKMYQDATTSAVVGPHGALTLGGIPVSISLLLPLFYLAISVSPAASTANNLGILLSSIPITTNVLGENGQHHQINGQSLALQYYTYGLQLDSNHPHLYTNLGSLLKDLNHLPEAIQMYEKAIACNPNFDVALANLGNAIKDQGRTQDSVQYYRRAVKVNPNFPEALCGLVNALLAICDWEEVYGEDDEGQKGLMKDAIALLEKQLEDGCLYGAGALSIGRRPEDWAALIVASSNDHRKQSFNKWTERIKEIINLGPNLPKQRINEGSFIIRIVERCMRHTQRRWYHDVYGKVISSQTTMPSISPSPHDGKRYARIPLPSCLGTPAVSTVLPFHTFTLKIPPRHIRLISHRTALRITQTTLSQLWLPSHVYPPPAPPSPRIRIGYVSSDFNNHPLAHLMQSCFGFHDLDRFEVFLYGTTASDNSPYRNKIEKEAEHFVDVSTWTNQAIISRILADGIHILMNLNGYTKGARNEIFAARPCPVQMEFMGFAGGMSSGWTDWVVVDPIVCPPEVTSTDLWRAARTKGAMIDQRPTNFDGDLDPESLSDDWEYSEKFIYMPDSYFVNDHRQGFREPEERKAIDGHIVHPHEMDEEEAWREEEQRRWAARKELWPSLPDDFFIFCDFNQLYKLEPTLFKLWLRILKRVPKSILWLLRFPAAGEEHLLAYARTMFGDQVASRVVFTDVAPKGVHIQRGRIADLFLDTLECGAHTTSADILWSGTPVLTWPKHRHKMASRVAASIVAATGLGEQMIVDSEQAYEDRAVELATGLTYVYVDENEKPLQVVQQQRKVHADALKFDNSSSSATPHGAAVSSKKGQKHEEQPPSSVAADEAPAPSNLHVAATASHAQEDPLPERSQICLATSDYAAPFQAVSRRGQGELAEMRKTLFLTRDSNRLFDTRLWVRHLEQGYMEAWRRWVLQTDTEDSEAWEALNEDNPIKQSGHIWISNLHE